MKLLKFMLKLYYIVYFRSGKKETLLAGKNADGIPALSITLQMGREEAIKVYIEAIYESDLELDQKERLLQEKL